MAPKFDVYAHVTDTIIAEIEAGTPPWRKPWTGSTSRIALPKRYNGEAYRGINILMLWVMAAKNGYVSSRWMTYRQAQELGGQVRGGETSATVVKYGTFTRENELGVDEELPYARAYRVFNADQIEGLAEDYYTRPEAPRDLGTEADPELAAFFARTGAEIVTSEDPHQEIREPRGLRIRGTGGRNRRVFPWRTDRGCTGIWSKCGLCRGLAESTQRRQAGDFPGRV